MDSVYNLFHKKDAGSSPLGASDPSVRDLEFVASIEAPDISTAIGIANSDTFVASPKVLAVREENRKTVPGDVIESNGLFWVLTPDGLRAIQGDEPSKRAPSVTNRDYYGQLFMLYGGILAVIDSIRQGNYQPSTLEPAPVSKPIYPGRTPLESVLLNF